MEEREIANTHLNADENIRFQILRRSELRKSELFISNLANSVNANMHHLVTLWHLSPTIPFDMVFLWRLPGQPSSFAAEHCIGNFFGPFGLQMQHSGQLSFVLVKLKMTEVVSGRNEVDKVGEDETIK